MKKLLLSMWTIGITFCLTGNEIKLENSKVSFVFSQDLNYGLTEIVNKETNRSIVFDKKMPGLQSGLWEMILIDDNTEFPVTCAKSNAKSEIVRKENGSELIITWEKIKVKNSIGNVTASIFLQDDNSIAQWSIKVTVTGTQAPWVKTVKFPLLRGIKSLGDDYLLTGESVGRIVRNPAKRLERRSIICPGSWSMQFAAFHGSAQLNANDLVDMAGEFKVNGFYRGPADDETGLFYSAADGAGWIKKLEMFRLKGQKDSFNMEIEHYPALDFWPPSKQVRPDTFNYNLPYKVMLGTFSGGSGKACSLYREWALDQPWMARGPLRKPLNPEKNSVSSKMLDCAFWGKFYHDAGKVVPEVAGMYKYLQVPMNLHWYRYYINNFDDKNPEYFPVHPYYREGVRDLKQMSIGVMPYVCCAIWDIDLKSWDKFDIQSAAAISEAGSPYMWNIYKQRPNAWMNPASALWQEKFSDINRKMFQDWGVSGEYLDVLAMAVMPCYNDKLNKPNGGTYWSDGNRKLLEKLRKDIRKISSETFLTTEGFCENYIDLMDGFLTLDIYRYGWREKRGYDNYPANAMVYHDYAITFSTDCNQRMAPEMLRWQMGLCFIWGFQSGYSSFEILKPETGGPANDMYTREIVRAWHQAGGKFLTAGRGVETAMVPDRKLAGNAAATIVSAQTSVHLNNELTFPWHGPSVPGSGWFAADGTFGFVLTNITNKTADAEVILDSAKLGMNGKVLWRSWPLPVQRIDKISGKYSMPLKVPAASAMIFELRDDTPPEIKPLENVRREFITAEKDRSFKPVKVQSGNLWGCIDSVVENTSTDNGNILNLRSLRTNTPRHLEKLVKWGTAEGYGKDRKIDDKPFYLLEQSPFKLNCTANTSVRFNDNVIFGRIDVKSAGLISGPQDSIILLARENKQLVLYRTEAPLQPGIYRFAAWTADNAIPVPDEKSLMKSLADISVGAIEQGISKLGAARIIAEIDKKLADKLLFTGNAAAYAAIGADCMNMMEYDWILPLITTKVEYKVNQGNGNIQKNEIVNLRKDLSETLSLKQEKDNTFSITPNSDSASANLVPLLFNCTINSNGMTFAVNNLSYFEIDHPLMADLPQEPAIFVNIAPGSTVQSSILIKNVSPYDLDVNLSNVLPDGWNVVFKGAVSKIHLNALSSITLPFEIKTSKNADKEEYNISLGLNYTENEETMVIKKIKIIMAPAGLEPVNAGAAKNESYWSPPQRFNGQLVVFAGPEKLLCFTAKAAYKPSQPFTWQLTDNMQRTVASGVIPKEKLEEFVTVSVPEAGLYNLLYSSNFFMVKIEKPAFYGYWSQEYRPLILFGGKTKLYFYVPADSKNFEISGINGGPDEPAKVTIIAPDGKIAFEHDGQWLENKWYNVPVDKNYVGKIWTININAVEDLKFKMRGDVVPCLSPDPAAVLMKR
jgi:hypothetical protein